MVVTGGYGDISDISNIAERYDPSSDTWQSLSPLPFTLFGHAQVDLIYH